MPRSDALDRLARELAGVPRMEGALCSGRVSEFDPFRGPSESPEAYRSRMTAARALCDQCPAREACLALGNALPAHTRAGVWGGVFFPEYESPTVAARRHRRNLRARRQTSSDAAPLAHQNRKELS